MIIITFENNSSYIAFLCTYINRSCKYITILPPSFPIRLIVNLFSFSNNIWNSRKRNRFCPSNTMSNITFCASLIQDNGSESFSYNSITYASEKV
jgi:hypothetical protein